MEFKNKYYHQEKFDKLVSEKEVLGEIEFEDCEFTNSSFIETKFDKCKFISCRFVGCLISASVPMDSHFVDTSFTKCKVIGMDWTKTHRIQDIGFDNCQINYSNFRQLKLPEIKITNCQAKEVDFAEADLTGADLSNSDLEKSVFHNTNLTKANFTGAKNYYIDIKNNIIKKARFSLPEAMSLLESLDIIIEQQ